MVCLVRIQLLLDAILNSVSLVWGLNCYIGPYPNFYVLWILQTIALGSPLDRAILFGDVWWV